MRILLYGINFTPELTGIGKYTGEMAKWRNGEMAKWRNGEMAGRAPP